MQTIKAFVFNFNLYGGSDLGSQKQTGADSIDVIGATLADVFILALRTNPGDGRQRAKERMGNENKNDTLIP